MSEHKCFKQIARELEKYNTRLVTNLLDPNQVMVATEKIKKFRDGKRAKTVIASYCPFCGEALGIE